MCKEFYAMKKKKKETEKIVLSEWNIKETWLENL